MTPRERVIRAFTRNIPDKVPKDLWVSFQIYQLIKQKTGSTDPLQYFDCEMRGVGWLPTKNRRDFSGYLGESSSHRLDKNLLATESEINKVPFLGERGGGDPLSVPWVDQEWGVGYIPTSSKDPKHAHLFGFVHPNA